ncbi:hypothetical protein F6X40_22230 [Paraburkholderia sp. UCT31]|nr:hypothetical protein [Paraburkholderia sp. UCT31]
MALTPAQPTGVFHFKPTRASDCRAGRRRSDEFARKLGGAALLLPAIDQPELKQYVTVTQQPESPPTE